MARRPTPTTLVLVAVGVVLALGSLRLLCSTKAASKVRGAAFTQDPEFTSRLVRLEDAVRALTARVDALHASSLVQPAMPERVPERTDEERSPLAARIEKLEQLVSAHPVDATDYGSGSEQVRFQRATSAERTSALQLTILDPKTSDLDKAQAWLDLSNQDAYPWTDEIIATMTNIGATSKNDRAREVVWIGADTEYRSDLLVQPLFAALNDPVADVREEAADALGHYLDYAGVRAALSWTSNNDTSEVVRNQALESLAAAK